MSNHCELFGIFGILVQCGIGLWCFIVLVFMWRNETPRRPFFTWILDMSKQMIGAGWGHFMNVFWALICGKALKTASHHNQCVWYLVGFLSDILLVTFLCWAVNTALRPVFSRKCGIDIGDYEGNTDSTQPLEGGDAQVSSTSTGIMWISQTALWLTIMTSVKFVVCIFCWLAQDYLYEGLAFLFKLCRLQGNPHAQLLVSVIFIPVIGDALQFAVQDTFLKNNKKERYAQVAVSGDNAQ